MKVIFNYWNILFITIFTYCVALYQAVAKMVQECYKYVDAVTDLTIKLRLIDTLRTVTAGKVCMCLKRALYERESFLYLLNHL